MVLFGVVVFEDIGYLLFIRFRFFLFLGFSIGLFVVSVDLGYELRSRVLRSSGGFIVVFCFVDSYGDAIRSLRK